MTLDSLIEWIDAAMARLPRDAKRADVTHVERLYEMLDPVGAEWEFRNDWHRLAVKVARILREPRPEAITTSDGGKVRRARTPRPQSNDVVASDSKSSSPRKSRRNAKAKSSATPSRASKFDSRPPRRRRLAEKPARHAVEINPQLQAAFDAVSGGKPIVFVTGGAGTGKSTFIRELRERFQEKNSVVLAPTGVAALNAGGQTIHSFCRLPLRPFVPTDAVAADEPELVRALDLVIIDEISMVRADTLDGIDAFLRLNRKSTLPFGGVQMIFVGDLFQLPPVVTMRDEQAIAERYDSPFFFAAHALRGLRFFPVELEKVYRQRDASFASLLGAIREGNAADALRELNAQCVGRELGGRHLILVPTRKAAATENDARLAALGGKPHGYTAAAEGTFRTASEDRFPAPQQLVLKRDAQVMFVRNDPERRWVNGTIGVVTELQNGKVTVRLEDGETHEVEPIEWQDVRYALDEATKKVVEEVAGTYRQLPLIPAWAVTIHKAQGLTLERALVDLDRGAFAEGQVYVALSRCQTLQGLSLRRPVRASEVRCSAAAVEFYARMRRRRVLPGD